ncbi:hypothetical protein AAMO2058_000150900 [Amorphochlora amoebiformis]
MDDTGDVEEKKPLMGPKKSGSASSQSRKGRLRQGGLSRVPIFKDDYGEGLRWLGGMFRGVMDDFRRRIPHYKSDMIDDAWNSKTFTATIMMFLATFISTIALGSTISRATDGMIGISEFLLMNGVAGMAHSLIGCQPLLIVRPTGPITLITAHLYALAGKFHCDFFVLLAWTGIFVGILMILIAGWELSRHIAILTPFSHDVFLFFVSTVYAVEGFTGVIERYTRPPKGAEGTSPHVALCISMYVLVLVVILRYSPTYFPKRIGSLLSDFSDGIAVFTATALSFVGPLPVKILRLSVLGGSSAVVQWREIERSASRPWIAPLGAGENAWVPVVIGLIVSIPVTIFFYLDQNVSALLAQQRRMQLSKGSYYHSSFLISGAFNLIFTIFGLPPATGSLPQSPQMVHALTNKDALPHEKKVMENRVAPLLVYSLIFLSLALFTGIIEMIPVAVADAILITVGLRGVFDTRLWKRLPTLFTPTTPTGDKRSSTCGTRVFLISQILVIGIVWTLNYTPVALAFPLVIAALIPLRMYILPKLILEADLEHLDPYEDDDRGPDIDVDADGKGDDDIDI